MQSIYVKSHFSIKFDYLFELIGITGFPTIFWIYKLNHHNILGLIYHIAEEPLSKPCADPESFDRGGPNPDNVVFLDDEGERIDPNTTESGPFSVRQQNAI